MSAAQRELSPTFPTVTRRLLLAVMWLNVLVYVAAPIVLALTFDPNRLYFVRRHYDTGEHRLIASTLACAVGAVLTLIYLFGFHRSDARQIAALYGALNAAVVQYPVFMAISQHFSGEEVNLAAGAFWAGWLSFTSAVAFVYWVRKRRYDAGGGPLRPAVVAIADALNARVR
jgi:hypothetical protein